MVSLRLYQALTLLAWPLFHLLLLRRRWRGKEAAYRVRERRAIATRQRAEGRLIWFHGASVGETLSILPLAQHLLRMFPRAHVLITSGTLTSAQLIAHRLPERAVHQFLPLDHPAWVERFLDTWRPDVGIWAESEVWPNMVWACAQRGVPLHLVNARLSAKSYRRWARYRKMAMKILGSFASVIAQTQQAALWFRDLGAPNVVMGGNIKFVGQELPAAETEVAAWRAVFSDRPVWFAASTHPGEEAQVLAAHDILKHRHPSLVTIIAPRHVDRLETLRQGPLADRAHALYSEGPDMLAGQSLLLIDQMGVLGAIYRACPLTLVAGSLVAHVGGHNPIEPARHGSAVLVGAHMDNQRDVVDLFLARDGLVQISDVGSLIDAVDALLSDGERRAELQAAGRAVVRDQADVLRLYSNALIPRLEPVLT